MFKSRLSLFVKCSVGNVSGSSQVTSEQTLRCSELISSAAATVIQSVHMFPNTKQTNILFSEMLTFLCEMIQNHMFLNVNALCTNLV